MEEIKNSTRKVGKKNIDYIVKNACFFKKEVLSRKYNFIAIAKAWYSKYVLQAAVLTTVSGLLQLMNFRGISHITMHTAL